MVLPLDGVFRALNDEGRRQLLDALLSRDGQTLRELCAVLPDMTRHGVMNHLRVLEDGGLIATAKVGRERHHYLNAVPIQLIHDRWINKFTAPTAQLLAHMTTDLEQGATMTKPDHVYETYIRCTPEAAWQAIVDGEILAVDPGHRLEMMFHARWSPELDAEGPVRMAWIVEEAMGLTKVRVEYYDLQGPMYEDFKEGLPFIVAGLKTLLETGAPIHG